MKRRRARTRRHAAETPRREAASAPRRPAAPARNPEPPRRTPATPPRTTGPPPRPGEWLWTTREGAEHDLVDEIALRRPRAAARRVAPGLVASTPLGQALELAFARQGFPISALAASDDVEALARELTSGLAPKLAGQQSFSLHVWVPDTDRENPLSARARTLEDALAPLLAEATGLARVDAPVAGSATPLVQVCLTTERQALAGACPAGDAPSLAPGGRTRVRAPRGKPSRSARKLEEAFQWLGTSPGPGELCVDLGAAPGGWSWVLLERRTRVVAVDPARLRPDLLRRTGLVHAQVSAFQYAPDEPADWLFCDMAWRPLEVAALLGKWARHRWATLLVANFKLPMRQKARMVEELRRALATSGWQSVRVRQLYHDRDEVTVTAHR